MDDNADNNKLKGAFNVSQVEENKESEDVKR